MNRKIGHREFMERAAQMLLEENNEGEALSDILESFDRGEELREKIKTVAPESNSDASKLDRPRISKALISYGNLTIGSFILKIHWGKK